MEIALARHGKPILPYGTWIVPRQLAEWIRAYDEAGIIIDDAPPEVGARLAIQRLPEKLAQPLVRGDFMSKGYR